MIQKTILFILFLGATTQLAAHSTISGSSSLSDVIFDELKVSGSLKCTNLTVHHKLKVSGSCKGTGLSTPSAYFSGSVTLHNSEIGALNTSGSTLLNNVTINETLTASGSLAGQSLRIAGNCETSGSLELKDSTLSTLTCSPKAKLHNSTTHTITIRHSSNRSGLHSDIAFLNWLITLLSSSKQQTPPTLYLHGNTTVNGGIIFEDGNGTVYCEKNAIITGTIQGGTKKDI